MPHCIITWTCWRVRRVLIVRVLIEFLSLVTDVSVLIVTLTLYRLGISDDRFSHRLKVLEVCQSNFEVIFPYIVKEFFILPTVEVLVGPFLVDFFDFVGVVFIIL